MKLSRNRLTKQDGVPYRVQYTDPQAFESLSNQLYHYFTQVSPYRQLVFVCIGSDRSTGDALGPLVGTQLKRLCAGDIHLFGTLDDPVHAMNLNDTIDMIEHRYDNPFVVAIDACLGQLSSVGHVTVAEGPVKPGAGVQKDLSPVGDMHLTGIVNVGGFMEYFVLQNTRLSIVMHMADLIANAISHARLQLRRPLLRPFSHAQPVE